MGMADSTIPSNDGRMSGDVIILYAINYKIFHTGRFEYPSKEKDPPVRGLIIIKLQTIKPLTRKGNESITGGPCTWLIGPAQQNDITNSYELVQK